jgi:nitrogenase molybdenum-iron protein alpha/beta subunit
MSQNARRVAGGKQSLGSFSSLLGLDRAGLPFRATQVSWLEDHFEVELDQDSADTLVLVIEASKGENQTRSFMSTGLLDIWYLGEQMTDELEAVLSEAIGTWSGLTVDRLLSGLLEDPDLKEIPRPLEPRVGAPQAAPDVAYSGTDQEAPRPFEAGIWDSAGSYADFLGCETIELMPFESIEASNPFVRISHSDLECTSSFSPKEMPSNLNLVEHTWITQAEGTAPKAQETSFCTDLTEHSVIMGCNQKVCELMDHVLARNLGKPIIFTNTCLPATTAEDVISVLKRYQDKAPVNITSHNRALTDFEDDMLQPLLVDRRLAAEQTADPADPRAINLVGFPRDESLDELEELLSGLGVRLNTAILPQVSEDDMARFPRAALNVFWRLSRSWQQFHQHLSRDSRIPSISPRGPFGIRGTRDWLKAIVSELGLEADVPAVVEKHLDPLRGAWEALAATVRASRVGLVVRPRDVDFLRDPMYTCGVPVLAMLEELGFQMEILIQTDEETGEGLVQRVSELLEDPARCRLATFDSLEKMREALANSKAQAFFSNFVFDWRLTEAGKNRFSLKHFEKGIRGAVKTARQITGICRIPFYKDYARAYRRTEMGLRPRRN